MVFLRDEETATRWVQAERGRRDVFRLRDAIRFAGDFFRPLMDS
jgi:hypothetical protein